MEIYKILAVKPIHSKANAEAKNKIKPLGRPSQSSRIVQAILDIQVGDIVEIKSNRSILSLRNHINYINKKYAPKKFRCSRTDTPQEYLIIRIT